MTANVQKIRACQFRVFGLFREVEDRSLESYNPRPFLSRRHGLRLVRSESPEEIVRRGTFSRHRALARRQRVHNPILRRRFAGNGIFRAERTHAGAEF